MRRCLIDLSTNDALLYHDTSYLKTGTVIDYFESDTLLFHFPTTSIPINF